MENATIPTAEYEGRKIGIQLFNQAEEMEALAALPNVSKWLGDMIRNTYFQFTMSANNNGKDNRAVQEWTHLQRLDWSFFNGMKSEIVAMWKERQRMNQPVPENCKGGFDHLVVSRDVPNGSQRPAQTLGARTQQLADGQGNAIPSGSKGVDLQSTHSQNTAEATTTELAGRQREDFRQSISRNPLKQATTTESSTHNPLNQRSATTTGPMTPSTNPGFGLGLAGTPHNFGTNWSSQPAQNNMPVPAVNQLMKSTDWVKARQRAIERQEAETSSRYTNADHDWLEDFVDFSGCASPAGEEGEQMGTGNQVTPPEPDVESHTGDLPDAPKSSKAPSDRRGSDTSVKMEVGSGVDSDAGAAGGSTSPEEDMDEVDMISTDHIGDTPSNRQSLKHEADVLKSMVVSRIRPLGFL